MNNRKRLSEDEVISFFEQEFGFVKNRFLVQNISLNEARSNTEISVNSPGIYIHWRDDLGVIKVGKSQSNSKKRALEHIKDNTKNDEFEMRCLETDENARLILFNILDKGNMHWLLSLEAYMDWNTNPVIPSGRIG